MSGGITVLGLIPGECMLEDIRVGVPYRTAVQIPAHLVQRSRNLVEALHQQRIMQLGNALPLPFLAPKRPVLAPILRGRGIAPHASVAPQQAVPGEPSWPRERESLVQELEASRAHCRQIQETNAGLQAALANMTNMANQLTQIQQALAGSDLRQASAPARVALDTPGSLMPAESSFLGDAVPHFIPSTAHEVAEVRISIPESASESDLSEVRGALRTLRGKPPV